MTNTSQIPSTRTRRLICACLASTTAFSTNATVIDGLEANIALLRWKTFHNQEIQYDLRPLNELNPDAASTVQHNLEMLGFEPGPRDGIVGPVTRSATIALLSYLRNSGDPLSVDRVISVLSDRSLFQNGETVENRRLRLVEYLLSNPQLNQDFSIFSDSLPLPSEGVLFGSAASIRRDSFPPDQTTTISTGHGEILLSVEGDLTNSSSEFSVLPDATAEDLLWWNQTREVLEVGGQIRQVPESDLLLNRPISSRRFSGPNQYPPSEFLGYALIASPSVPMSSDIARFAMLCEAYATSLFPVGQTEASTEQQFVTVWPVIEDVLADRLNSPENSGIVETCLSAVENYDQATALEAIDAARVAGYEPQGRGPFVLGWLPSNEIGQPESLVLTMNLSQVSNPDQAAVLFAAWRRDVETNPELLARGFSAENLRRNLQRWADLFGPDILGFWRRQ